MNDTEQQEGQKAALADKKRPTRRYGSLEMSRDLFQMRQSFGYVWPYATQEERNIFAMALEAQGDAIANSDPDHDVDALAVLYCAAQFATVIHNNLEYLSADGVRDASSIIVHALDSVSFYLEKQCGITRRDLGLFEGVSWQ